MRKAKGLTGTQATEAYRCRQCEEEGDGACEFDCVLSVTCSLLCKGCRRAVYLPGNWADYKGFKAIICPRCGVENKPL